MARMLWVLLPHHAFGALGRRPTLGDRRRPVRLLLRCGGDAVEMRAVAQVAQCHEGAGEGRGAVVERDAGYGGKDGADLACLRRTAIRGI